MASYNNTASETSSSTASESETEIGLFDKNRKKISVQGRKITKCKLILRSGVSLIQCVNVNNDIVFSIMQLSFAWCILNNSCFKNIVKLNYITNGEKNPWKASLRQVEGFLINWKLNFMHIFKGLTLFSLKRSNKS